MTINKDTAGGASCDIDTPSDITPRSLDGEAQHVCGNMGLGTEVKKSRLNGRWPEQVSRQIALEHV